jgi:hypothetical protein
MWLHSYLADELHLGMDRHTGYRPRPSILPALLHVAASEHLFIVYHRALVIETTQGYASSTLVAEDKEALAITERSARVGLNSAVASG